MVSQIKMHRRYRYISPINRLKVRILTRLPLRHASADPVIFIPPGVMEFLNRAVIYKFTLFRNFHSIYSGDVRDVNVQQCVVRQAFIKDFQCKFLCEISRGLKS